MRRRLRRGGWKARRQWRQPLQTISRAPGVVVAPDRGPGFGQGAGGNAGPAAAVGLPKSDGSHDADDVPAKKGIDEFGRRRCINSYC